MFVGLAGGYHELDSDGLYASMYISMYIRINFKSQLQVLINWLCNRLEPATLTIITVALFENHSCSFLKVSKSHGVYLALFLSQKATLLRLSTFYRVKSYREKITLI